MQDDKNDKIEAMDKTDVIDSDTLKIRIEEAKKAPPALVLLNGPSGIMGKSWSLDKEEMSVGRDLACDIQIDEKSLSKKHAVLRVENNTNVTIIDQASTNGTEVVNQRLLPNAPQALANNDRIKLGNVIFKFLSQGNIETVAAARLYDKSTIDGLTQILNKQSIMNLLEDGFKRSRAQETHLCVIVFDLDHFKKVNDTFGHPAGDYVLREVSQVVKNGLIRAGDTFGRYGGEEFVIILQGSPLHRAVEVAERIRLTIEKHIFEFAAQKIHVTVSLGVAALDSSMQDHNQLFTKADQSAYLSKKAGRNRVSIL